MTRLAKWVERHWHGPRTRRYDATHHGPIVQPKPRRKP